MQSFIPRRLLTMMLIVLQLFMQFVSLVPRSAWAQEGFDTEPPVIELNQEIEGIKGESQLFSVTVTDDIGIDSVLIHYRLDDESAYQNEQMEVIGSTDVYSILIPVDSSIDVVQYYIEASDTANNRTLQGFAFDPIERQLFERQAPVVQQTTPVESTGMSTGKKVLYGVLGLVVVGAIASAAGGSSGDEASEVGVTVIVEPLE